MLPGEVVANRFELERLAKAGGMGAVWRGRDRLTGETVAIKLLRDPEHGGHDDRFLREAALLAELRHPAIVRHIAHGRTREGDLYLAMEWLQGEDLAQRLGRGALETGDALRLVRRVADALALLHDRGGLHRDLKPANLFLEDAKPERVKLLDFGIARAAATMALTSTGTIMGTPGYTAPEQARGSKDVDARADVFALGCVLFECLTGRVAFGGDHVMTVLARILLEDPPRLSDVTPEAPPALEALVASCLHKDPSRRPRDAGELRDLLDAVSEGSASVRLVSTHTPRPPSLGSDEQRFMCLVLCADPESAGGVGALPTLAPASVVTPLEIASAAVPLASAAAAAPAGDAPAASANDGPVAAANAIPVGRASNGPVPPPMDAPAAPARDAAVPPASDEPVVSASDRPGVPAVPTDPVTGVPVAPVRAGSSGPVTVLARPVGATERPSSSIARRSPSIDRRSSSSGRPGGTDPTIARDAHPSPEHLSALVRSHGGRLERLADGSWVAVADRGSAHAPATDQATQAARIALALARALPTSRVAIASGRGVRAGRAPVGDVIDRAIALVGAPGGGIAIDPLTAGLLGGGFELRDDGGTLRLVGESADAEPETRARRVLGRPTPCVGRDRELTTLMGLFDDAISEPCARVVLVRGPAGHGKSRLRSELLVRLRARGVAFEWLYGRGDPLHAGAPFAIAAQVVRRAAGIVDGEPLEVRRGRLAARVAAVVPAPDRDRIITFLGELAHAPADVGPALASARRDALVMGDQLRRAWDDWLAAETERRPVVMVLEDLHLGDLSSVKLIDSALRNLRERPLLVLALARPEIDLAFPGLWSERGLVTIPLPELSRRAATRLVREILGDAVSDARVERIVARAGGNAFYLEELCRVMHDGAETSELPGTVLAMAQARLEGVDPESRRLLRAASVFGMRFARGGALALWSGDPDDAAVVGRMLDALVERELLEPVGAEFHGEPTFAFRHALVREAAYAMLTASDRQLGHRLAAAWLAGAGISDPVLLAEHHERGGEPERAIDGYLAAARDALEGNDLAAVLARVERGLACGARGEQLGELLVLRAEAHRWRSDYTAAIEAASLAMAVLPAGSRGWCQAATQALAAYLSTAQHERLDELLARTVAAPKLDPVERLRTIAKGAVNFYLIGDYDRADELITIVDTEVARAPIDDAMLEARIHEAHAFREGARAEQGRALALLEAAAAAYRRAGDLRSACMSDNNVGYTYSQLGDYARAVAILDETLRAATRMGVPHIANVVEQNLGLALAYQGQLARGEQILRHTFEAFRRTNDLHMAGVSRTYLSILHLRAGDARAAEDEATVAVGWVQVNLPAKALALAALARARTAGNDAAGALAAARDGYAIVESLGGLDEGEMQVRLALVEALAANGLDDEARAVARVAADRIAALAAKLPAPLRTSFLTRVPENAALLALAQTL